MRLDEEMAAEVRAGRSPATLRVYGWNRPTLSLGRTQAPASLRRLGLPALPRVRRPTGGGAVVHRLDELTYAAAIPAFSLAGARLREVPQRIHRFLLSRLLLEGQLNASDLSVAEAGPKGPFPLCFDAPVEGDVLFRGRKVAGSALRVWKEGILIQGSIQGLPVDRELLVRFLTASIGQAFQTDER